MSMKTCEEKMFMADVYAKLAEAEADIKEGRMSDAREGLYHLLQEGLADVSRGKTKPFTDVIKELSARKET